MKSFFLFVREAMLNPLKIGAPFPSSKRLAKAMTEQIPVNLNGVVLELGAGTGIITEALLEHYIPAQNIVVIERSANLANHLQNRFPQLKIIQGDARELGRLLDPKHQTVKHVVSSLPLRNLPQEIINTIGQELDKVLEAEGLYIQYTYNLWSKPLFISPKLRFISSKMVVWNLPPARVDIYRREE